MGLEPKFIEWPEKKVVGMGTNFISILSPDRNNAEKIPALWHAFVNRQNEIQNRTGEASYGLVAMLPAAAKKHRDELFYFACCEVTAFGALPAGMEQRTIAAGRYASFTHVGSLGRLGETMRYIYGVWLPQSGIKLREVPHVELYDRRFAINSETSEFDMLLPIV